MSENNSGYTEFFSVGCDFYGQLGHGQDPDIHDRKKQTDIPKSLSFDIMINKVACGHSHTLLLAKSGEVYGIGNNVKGQLGLGDKQLEFSTAPLLVKELKNQDLQVVDIASGGFHNLALAKNGCLLSWGSNNFGECAQKLSCTNEIFFPLKIQSEALQAIQIKSIHCGENFSGILTNDGNALMFGSNQDG